MMKKFLQQEILKLLMKQYNYSFKLEYDKINNIFKAKKNAVANDFEKKQLFMQMKSHI